MLYVGFRIACSAIPRVRTYARGNTPRTTEGGGGRGGAGEWNMLCELRLISASLDQSNGRPGGGSAEAFQKLGKHNSVQSSPRHGGLHKRPGAVNKSHGAVSYRIGSRAANICIGEQCLFMTLDTPCNTAVPSRLITQTGRQNKKK